MGFGCRCERVALYVYGYQEVNNYVTLCHNIIQHLKYHKTPPIPIMLKVINANSLPCCSLLGV